MVLGFFGLWALGLEGQDCSGASAKRQTPR